MTVASETDVLSQELFEYLSDDTNVVFPDLPDMDGDNYALPTAENNPIYDKVERVDNDDLTTKIVDGKGVFDVLLTAIRANLQEEFQAGRITGDKYATALIELITAAMGTAVNFLTARDQLYWQNLLTQAQAKTAEVDSVTAKVNLEIAKATLIQNQANLKAQYEVSKSQYALNKMQLSVADADYLLKGAQLAVQKYQATDILPTQKTLLSEQMESARAQTMDTRSDGSTMVEGSVGKQKDLYDQQIDSYQKDSRYKIGKMLVDSWVAQKTLDEDLTAPNAMTNSSLETVITSLKSDNSLT